MRNDVGELCAAQHRQILTGERFDVAPHGSATFGVFAFMIFSGWSLSVLRVLHGLDGLRPRLLE